MIRRWTAALVAGRTGAGTRTRRFPVCVLLVIVLLATVLAPGFGWEVAAGLATHPESAQLGADSGQAGEGPEAADHDDCAQHGGHGCVGHMFGHLNGAPGPGWLMQAVSGRETVRSFFLAMCTQFHERVEHPPKSCSLA